MHNKAGLYDFAWASCAGSGRGYDRVLPEHRDAGYAKSQKRRQVGDALLVCSSVFSCSCYERSCLHTPSWRAILGRLYFKGTPATRVLPALGLVASTSPPPPLQAEAHIHLIASLLRGPCDMCCDGCPHPLAGWQLLACSSPSMGMPAAVLQSFVHACGVPLLEFAAEECIASHTGTACIADPARGKARLAAS